MEDSRFVQQPPASSSTGAVRGYGRGRARRPSLGGCLCLMSHWGKQMRNYFYRSSLEQKCFLHCKGGLTWGLLQIMRSLCIDIPSRWVASGKGALLRAERLTASSGPVSPVTASLRGATELALCSLPLIIAGSNKGRENQKWEFHPSKHQEISVLQDGTKNPPNGTHCREN